MLGLGAVGEGETGRLKSSEVAVDPPTPGAGPTRGDSGSARAPPWQRLLVPAITSERHALVAFLIGFLTQIAAEVYQTLTTARGVHTSPIGYYSSIAVTLLGFYYFWRGFHEWNRLHPRSPRGAHSPFPWAAVYLLLGGFVAVAAADVLTGSLHKGGLPFWAVWIVGAAIVFAFGSFFLRLREIVAPYQRPIGRALGWGAFAWSLGVSVYAGLQLGLVIDVLFRDFFTSWNALITNIAPFIYALAPLFVTWILLTGAYLDAYPRAPGRTRAYGG